MSFIAAGLSLAGGIAGSAIQANATKDAAKTQADSATQAQALQQQMYQQQRQDQQPWQQAGVSALSQMQNPYFQKNFSASDFQTDPGYQFRLQQGTDAIQRSAAARGGLQSGGTLKGLNDYAQGFASNEYQNAYNRFTNDQNNRFGRLATLSGYGQNAVGQLGQGGQNYANQGGNIITNNGNAQAAATMAQGQTWGNMASGIGNSLGKTWGNLSSMGGMGGGGGAPSAYSVGNAGSSLSAMF